MREKKYVKIDTKSVDETKIGVADDYNTCVLSASNPKCDFKGYFTQKTLPVLMNPFSEINAKIAAEGSDYTDSYAEEYYYDDEDDGGLFSAEAAALAAPSGHCPGQSGCSKLRSE